MESLERLILAELGIADPYAPDQTRHPMRDQQRPPAHPRSAAR